MRKAFGPHPSWRHLVRPHRLALPAAALAATALLSGPAAARPSIISGLGGGLNTPSQMRTAVQARLPNLPADAFAETRQLQQGARHVVRFRQHHAGVPVVGRGVGVVATGSGAFAIADIASSFAGSPIPTFSRGAAGSRARAAAGIRFEAKRARLAWLPQGSAARLVWTFYRGNVGSLPYAPLVVIDAHSGELLLNVNAVHFDRAATVHQLNPVTTPIPQAVVLEDLAPGAKTLANERISVTNCIDKGTTSGGQFQVHICESEQKALADASGDFPYTYPGDTWAEDEYAEVIMFYHVSKAYSFMEGLGMPALNAKPLNAFVNVRMPAGFSTFDLQLMQNTSLPLEPYNNAFYTPQNPFFQGFGPDGTGLWFGQGKFADFAYDGDVVYHEFGHAMIDRTIDLVPFWHLDEMGAWPSPGAMNEGFADYFSSALAGDGKVGEYAAQNVVPGFLGSQIRSIENDHTCPSRISGEVHTDSTHFSGALWTVRKSLSGGDQSELDKAVMATLVAAPSGDVDFADIAQAIAASVEVSPLGSAGAATLTTEFTKRGVLPGCARTIEYEGMPIIGPELALNSSFYSGGKDRVPVGQGAPYAPGILQFHRTLPDDPDMDILRVTFQRVQASQASFGGNSTPFDPALLVQFSDTPISFSYESGITSSAGDPVEVAKLGITRSAEVPIPDGAKSVYVMIVNKGDQNGLYRNISLLTKSSKTTARRRRRRQRRHRRFRFRRDGRHDWRRDGWQPGC